jgi:alpha-amylase
MKQPKFKALWAAILATGMVGGISMQADAQAITLNSNGTSVQMFHWKWNDIAKECTNWLGPQGYGAVQISPPHASAVAGAWWDIYQPVDYSSLTSRFGTEAELTAMITTCHNAKVRVYADIVANHLSAMTGTATSGASFNASTLTYPKFSSSDFHSACDIQQGDYGSPGNRSNVINCRLSTLPDLNTGSAYVQGQLKTYLTKLLSLGVDGFRFDAAKHMAPADMLAIANSVSHTTNAGEALWVTQEVIPDGNVVRSDYFPSGTLNEFQYPFLMKAMFRNESGQSLSQVRAYMGTPGNWGGTWGFVDSPKATVFVNNWDTERDGSSLNASNNTGSFPNDSSGTKRYDLANIFMLSWPYGHVQVHSGFKFTVRDQDRPSASPFDASGNPLINQSWDFIHRWSDISNMVAFRTAAAGTGVDNFTNGTVNQIAFNRGAKGFVAINNDSGTAWNLSFTTLLPAGTYCNVAHGTANPAKTACSGDQVVVAANGAVSVSIPANGGTTVPAVVLQAGQTITGGACTSVSVLFRVSNANTVLGQNVYVAGNRAELGTWTPTSANLLNIEGSGANVPWSRTIQLPPSTAIQFKFMKSGAVANVWERNQATASTNREIVTVGCGSTQTVDVGSFQF